VAGCRPCERNHSDSQSLRAVPGKIIEKDPKTHQIRVVSIDRITLESLHALKAECASGCEQAGERLSETAFVFFHQPDGLLPWRPNYVTLSVPASAMPRHPPHSMSMLT
jgi:hypothetical protein